MEKISEKLNKLIEACNAQFRGFSFNDVKFSMNGRLTSTAGRAFLEEGRLEFSKVLYIQNVEKFLEDTVPHELAHIVAFRVFGDKGHGVHWKHIMNFLGYDANRCHNYAVQRRSSAKTYSYTCGCKDKIHEVSAQRQAWINKGKRYCCEKCGILITVKD
jgi:SprT protein